MKPGQRIFLVAGLFFWLMVNLVSGMAGKQCTLFWSERAIFWAVACLAGTVFCMGLKTLICLVLGRHFQLSYFYPFLSINYVLSCFIGVVCFGETFRWGQLIGAIVILTGTLILGFSKNALEPQRRA